MVGVKLSMLAALGVWLLCAPLSAGLSSEAGAFVFQYYSPKVYDANPQNWAMAQDHSGIMYFGNTECILQFDGVTWRKIPLTNGSVVRSLAVDEQGTVYAGGVGIFGYLKPDRTGTLQFVSLLDKIPEDDRKFSDVWTILPTPQGMYFQSYQRVFRLGVDGKIIVWKSIKRFDPAFYAMGSVFLADRNVGIFRIKGDRLIPIAGLAPLAVRSAIPFSGGVLLATRERLYTFNGSTLKPLPTSGDEYLQKNLIYSTYRMANGEILVGTLKGGMMLMDEEGKVNRIIGKEDGLMSDYVTSFFADREHGLWVSLGNGLVRFEQGLTQFGARQDLRGNVLAIVRQGGEIYAGTTAGLFRMKTSPGKEAGFEPVDSISQPVYASFDNGAENLVGSLNGLFRVTGTSAERLLDLHSILDIAVSKRDPNVFYTAGADGITVIRKAGGDWSRVNGEAGNNQEFRTVIEDADGRVWATTQSDIWRIDFNTEPHKTERFTAVQGVPANWKNADSFRGHVVFGTAKGLLKFDETQHRFVPDPEIGTQFSDGSKAVSIVREDQSKNVWVTGAGYHGVLKRQRNGQFHWIPMPLVRSGIEEMFAFHVDADGTCWAAGADGTLFRWADSGANLLNRQLEVLTRRVEVSGRKEALFGGSAIQQQIRLPYRDRDLRFEFAAPSFEAAPSTLQAETPVEYQVRLNGFDSDWTPWTHETRKDYTNLSERNYEFRVRARDAHGVVSPEAHFTFKVLPPWFRTWWAYIVWATAGVLAVWSVIRWRLRALQERNERLEQIVEERTVEVRMQRDQIQAEERKSEALLTNILPTSIAGELKSTGSVTPMAFDDVTVCFTDFVGFTLSSEKLPPTILVAALNDYFTAFDEITGRYGLEKLKTIGDAYMLVSGLPQPNDSHAVDAVLAAMEMAETVKRLSEAHPMVKWKVRIGLHSGPVIAGVVGVRKFAFDIWGDTVNFAARMESSGSAGRVNMSATTYSRVKDFIDCEYRGQVRIKEGRELDMYFANGPSANLGGRIGPDGIPEAFRLRYREAFHHSPASFPALLVNAAS